VVSCAALSYTHKDGKQQQQDASGPDGFDVTSGLYTPEVPADAEFYDPNAAPGQSAARHSDALGDVPLETDGTAAGSVGGYAQFSGRRRVSSDEVERLRAALARSEQQHVDVAKEYKRLLQEKDVC